MNMNYRNIIFLFFILCALAPMVANADEFDTLMEKIRADFVRNPSAEKIKKALSVYDAEKGRFTDVDYSRRDRTNWEPLVHIDRLYDFSFAYTHPGNAYYQDDTLYGCIVKGLEYWYECNPNCSNWWYNQIAEPQKIGILLIQMRVGKKQIPSDLEEKTLQRIRKEGGDPAKWTGANRTDIALHWIYRSCLEKNEKDLTKALENAYSPVAYTVKEGFQHDNCYFQHGVQLYIGGYGDEILKGVTQVAMYTRGTKYAMDDEKIQLLSRFMRQTYYRTIRGKYMLFDVMGRGISRKNVTDKSGTALFAQRMMMLDPEHADEYRAIVARLKGERPADYQLQPSHTHYFRGDYTLHVRPGYTFDVRMVSRRTMRCEYGNGENLKTYFMSDGCTNIAMQGDEYTNIPPVWDWRRIPGTTAPQVDTIPKAASDWQTRGTSTFAGGVSDSLYGVSAYVYDDRYAGVNTGARKAWFFFDNEVVCLGAGIHSSCSVPLYTTINQCLLYDKEILLSQGNKLSVVGEGEHVYDSPDWVLHNGVGYLFPAPKSRLFLNRLSHAGTWREINRTQSADTVRRNVFTLGFDHGTAPQSATYAYVVVPGVTDAKQLQAYRSKKKTVEILLNTDSLQAVRHNGLNIWQMVFYRAGTFKHKELTVTVDKPCALLLKGMNRPSDVTLHIADPAQSQSCINVEITIPKIAKESRNISCHFEGTGIYAGASKKYTVYGNR